MITPENADYIDFVTDKGMKRIFNRLIQIEESQPNRIMRKRVENFGKSCIRCKIKISAEQTKLTTNSTNGTTGRSVLFFSINLVRIKDPVPIQLVYFLPNAS